MRYSMWTKAACHSLFCAAVALSLTCAAAEKPDARLPATAAEPVVKLINPELFSNAKPFSLKNYKDKVVLLEFWATWCPPCRRSVPHLSKLQSEHPDDLVVLGVSNEAQKTVEKFYNDNKDHMKYRVALDAGSTNKDYMSAYNVRGIPHAFVIADGKIVWHGHPMDGALEGVLESHFKASKSTPKTKTE